MLMSLQVLNLRGLAWAFRLEDAGHILWFIFRFYGLSHASGEGKSAGLAPGGGLGLPA